jgi:flagellar basal body-associated protein FliL
MNDVWIPIAIILVIYVVSVAVVIVYSTSKRNRETTKRGFIKCNVCGAKIYEGEEECPKCHQILKKKE